MKRFGIFSLLAIGMLAVAAFAFPMDILAAQVTPGIHAGALAIAQPFTDPGFGLVMAGAAFGTHDYWHPIRQVHKHPAVVPNFVIAATSADCPDGILEIDQATGFSKLLAFESLRQQCAGSADPNVRQLAQGMPALWSYDPAVDRDDLTEEQKFNVVTNCAKATTLSGSTSYWTAPTMNTPDPSGTSRWIEGDVIPNAGALPTNIGLNDLPGFAQAMLKRSALAL